MKVTKDFLEENRSKGGGWTKNQLAILGIKWPPYKGWIHDVVGMEITASKGEEFARDRCPDRKPEALPAFLIDRLGYKKKEGFTEFDLGCLALEKDGLPCPMNIDSETWVRNNFAYIVQEYRKIFPVTERENVPFVGRKREKPKKKWRKPEKKSLPNELKNFGKVVIQPLPAYKRMEAAEPMMVIIEGVDVRTKDFLKTYQWRKTRMKALKTYGAKCMCCGATPATGAVMNVDHIKPRITHPSKALDLDNLQILCEECNHGKGNWDETDWRAA